MLTAKNEGGTFTASLTLGALGVVFGDIGTSPLYGVQQCFLDFHAQSPTPSVVLGILSLIFWSLILVVCVKYLTFIIRCDHDGEGGTLALLGLVQAKQRSNGGFPGGVRVDGTFWLGSSVWRRNHHPEHLRSFGHGRA
jgi:K+ transporter